MPFLILENNVTAKMSRDEAEALERVLTTVMGSTRWATCADADIDVMRNFHLALRRCLERP
jgi:hypothetical protein